MGKAYSCANCGQRFATKGDKHRHKETCHIASAEVAQADGEIFSRPIKLTQAEKAEAHRQWNEIPDDLAELARWMKLPPVVGEGL